MSRALLDAASNGDLAKVRAALDAGADIDCRRNAKTSTGRTPLIEATIGQHEDVVRFLLERNAKIEEACTAVGLTALAWAVEQNDEALVELLLAHHANPNAVQREFKNTPLMIAFRNVAIAKRLLAAGADVNASKHDGVTVLGVAEERGDAAVVALLRKHGARVTTIAKPIARISWPKDKCDFTKPESVLRCLIVEMNAIEKRAPRRGMAATLKDMNVVLARYCTKGKTASSYSEPPAYDPRATLIDVKTTKSKCEMTVRDAADKNEFLYIGVKKNNRWILDKVKHRMVGTSWSGWHF